MLLSELLETYCAASNNVREKDDYFERLAPPHR
jgi:hypothetical protein